ncbi:lytic murein transglycosylase B [Actimicrobium antarcticum]|uniref:Transglycosylase SLT domain-containing protein n=1 Tax=Actimicrobium antarcticum TaxID=1051899 RepID=A0ABP7TE95_9BURK
MTFPSCCKPVLRTALLTLSLSLCLAATASAGDTKRKSAAATRATAMASNGSSLGEFADFSQWKEVTDFIDLMVNRHGFDRTELDTLFRKTLYVESAVQLMKPAPAGRPKNWNAYRARFVEPVRINGGVKFWNDYADALARAEAQFGVPAEIIVAIIGVETVYGRNTGNYRVMDAITTLAFNYPDTPTRAARMQFFRGELENTLLFARDSRIDPLSLQGSYAGAIGWPQFMPGSIREYAVDFDGDGKIDLRNSPVDAIGSVASFLTRHGWRRGEPTVFPVTSPTLVAAENSNGARAWDAFIGQGLSAKFGVDELTAAGIMSPGPLPAGMLFGLVDLQNGSDAPEFWLGTDNFFAITQYNRSFFYAMSVIDLARAVRTVRATGL